MLTALLGDFGATGRVTRSTIKTAETQRRAVESKGLGYSADKAVKEELQVERMGA